VDREAAGIAGPAVVVGGAGGIGLALVEAVLAEGAHAPVVVLSRQRPANWRDDPRLVWLAADILDEASLATAAGEIRSFGEPTLVLVATGVLQTGDLVPEKSMRALDLDRLTRIFQINAAGPALVAKHLLPLTPRDRRSVMAVLSARVGSIGDNQLGGWYGYRASKSALNMLVRTLAIEHRRTRPMGLCVALHPGTVETTLSAPFPTTAPGKLRLTPDRSARALLDVLGKLGPEANGGFYAWDGQSIEW